MLVRIPIYFCVSCVFKECVPSVYLNGFFCVSAVYLKDCGSRKCAQGTKIWES